MVDNRANQIGSPHAASRVLLIAITFFASIVLTGYGLNLLGFAANPVWMVPFVALQVIAGIALIRRQLFRQNDDPLERAGFLLVTLGTWVYFVLPALPTLLPPSYSVDAVRHVAFANTIYDTGQIITDYPGGVALIVATLAHWTGALPLRALHPLTALWIALTAGAIYALTCFVLPERRANKTIALAAVLALFTTWDHFGGMLIAQQYYATQILAQLNLVAFVLFLAEYRATRARAWLLGMSGALLTISVTFQLLLALPLALLGWTLFENVRRAEFQTRARDFAFVFGSVVAFWLALLASGGNFIPQLSRVSTGGNVAVPSFESLGGAFILLPIAGIILSRGLGERVVVARMFLFLAIAQSVALSTLRLAGFSAYWTYKSFYPLVLPLAVFAALAVARAAAFGEKIFRRASFPASAIFCIGYLVLAGWIVWMRPPAPIELLSESDLQVAQWAKEHLNTHHINYISRKNIVANWLGVGLWNETYPADLFVDLATLGPKTYEEWRADPAWGEYLFVTSQQNLPPDATLQIVYQRGASLIALKPEPARDAQAGAARVRIGDLFALRDSTPLPAILAPGGTLSLTLQLETDHIPNQDVVWRLQLRDLTNNAIAEARRTPFDGKFPLHRWPDSILLTQPLTMALPVEIRPGLYDVQLGLYGVRTGEPVLCDFPDGAQDDVIHLGKIKVPVPPVTTHELGALARVDAQIGDAFRLLGYRLRKNSLRPGDSTQVILYWQVRARVSDDYTVFVHLLDSSGILVAQRDTAPRAGTYPTVIWAQNEIVPDAYELTIPRDAAPGDYRVIVGMYQWQNLARLPVTDTAQRALGDHFELPIVLQVTAD